MELEVYFFKQVHLEELGQEEVDQKTQLQTYFLNSQNDHLEKTDMSL